MNCPHIPIEKAGDPASGSSGEADAATLPPFRLKALRLAGAGWGEGWVLHPLPPKRSWMDSAPYAYQCPPMVVANQWGWLIFCPTDVRATWDGGLSPSSLTVEVAPAYAPAIKSQFGQGIVTFGPPWLFRTSPGWDLMVKGPSNHWKPNCASLEGVIETWWIPYTFTLNWKLVEPGVVTFRRGEPLAQLVPVPHHTFRGATAEECPIEDDPEAHATLKRWQAERERRASEKVTTHHLYRKAEGISEHLTRVPVPAVSRPGTAPAAPAV